jgi:GntR family transcriptional regulator
VAADIRAKIRSGEYPPGSQLPSTAELIEHYGVSETVINYAVLTLRGEHLIEGQQGKGRYVADPLPPES